MHIVEKRVHQIHVCIFCI